MAALPGKTIAVGNPPSSDHQIDPTQLGVWMEEKESKISATEARLDGIDTSLASVDAEMTTITASVDALAASQVSGLLVRSTWTELQSDVGSADGDGAEVLDDDTGTHLAASATGYDGASVPNAGRYAWNAAWTRWVRLGSTGLSGKAPSGSIEFVPLTQDNASSYAFQCSPVGLASLSSSAAFTLIAPSDRQEGDFAGVSLEVAGLNDGDARQVRYYPGDASDDQIGQMAWKAGDRLEFGPLTAGGWFPLLWPPRPATSVEVNDEQLTFFSLRANQIAALGAQQ